MENDCYFKNLCWVCLAEKSDMDSIINNNANIQIDKTNSYISLYDMLSYVVADEICFMNGPHLICDTCKMQAYTAYKFKKRCEVSQNVFKKSGLIKCDREVYSMKLEDLIMPEDISVKEEVTYIDETCEEEIVDDVVANVEFEKDDANVTMDYLEDPIAERSRLPNSSNKTFLCNICGLQKSKQGIKQHMLRHSNARTYSCQFCERRFNDKGNLNVHIRIHTGVHPYTCNVCGKKFIQASGLKTHKRMHDDVKPYKCHICPYSTRTSSHLQLHIKRHIGIKNYQCDQCDYAACSKAELKYHFAKHSSDKNFVCDICGKGFTRYKGLKTHEKSHSGEKPHICELCGRGFTQAHSLRSHLRNIHKQEEK